MQLLILSFNLSTHILYTRHMGQHTATMLTHAAHNSCYRPTECAILITCIATPWPHYSSYETWMKSHDRATSLLSYLCIATAHHAIQAPQARTCFTSHCTGCWSGWPTRSSGQGHWSWRLLPGSGQPARRNLINSSIVPEASRACQTSACWGSDTSIHSHSCRPLETVSQGDAPAGSCTGRRPARARAGRSLRGPAGPHRQTRSRHPPRHRPRHPRNHRCCPRH